ncbi:hypothetical protein ACHAPT_005351 [Fusarium lateritium]
MEACLERTDFHGGKFGRLHLQRAGIRPSGVVGHSSGEIAAAYAARAISLEEAIIVAYYRGSVAKLQTRTGGMGAIGLGVADVSRYIQDDIVIACDNSPKSVTLFGDVKVLDKVLTNIKAENPDALTRRLKVEIAYHSDHMKPLAAKCKSLMESELAKGGLRRPTTIDIPILSSVTGKIITSGKSLGPDYRVSNLTSRARFATVVEDEPWLAGYKVGSDVVFPFAGYISMAAEAIRQTTDVSEGYKVRNVTARSAMVLSDQLVEVVITLRPARLSDTAVSGCFNFTIVSHNGSSWTLHFEGQIKACTDVLEPSLKPNSQTLVRPVASASWYDALEHVGLVYGPEFQALEDIMASATENLAVAKINNESRQGNEAFLCHPAAIDNCLQLLAAMTGGLGRNFGQLRVPTSINDLFVRRSALIMNVVASSRNLAGLAVGVVTDGRVALRLNGLQLTLVDDGQDQQQERHVAARLEWLPDFDLIDHKTLFSSKRIDLDEAQMDEEMTLLCILEAAERVRDLKPCDWHFEKFRKWLDMEIERARQGTYPVIEKQSRAFVGMSSPSRRAKIEE